MRAYVDVGCSAFYLKILPLQLSPTLDQMRLIAEDVLPVIRAHGSAAHGEQSPGLATAE